MPSGATPSAVLTPVAASPGPGSPDPAAPGTAASRPVSLTTEGLTTEGLTTEGFTTVGFTTTSLTTTPAAASSPSGAEVGRALLAEAERRLFEESLPRLRTCLAELSPEEIWRRPNAHLSAVGNLVLHLAGNARQWIVCGLGGAADHRDRDGEFAATTPLPTAELLAHLEVTMDEVRGVLRTTPPENLLVARPVQAFVESGLAIVVHVVEHFSYHVGQIAFATKLLRDRDLGFYRGVDLTRRAGAADEPLP